MNKRLLSAAFLLASLGTANAGYPLGWVYTPTAKPDDCDRWFTRCIITDTRVEVHSRPNKKSPVIAVFNGGPVWIGDNVRKWDFIGSSCPLVQNDDGTLSIKPNQNGGSCYSSL
jgi:hypothetical protein